MAHRLRFGYCFGFLATDYVLSRSVLFWNLGAYQYRMLAWFGACTFQRFILIKDTIFLHCLHWTLDAELDKSCKSHLVDESLSGLEKHVPTELCRSSLDWPSYTHMSMESCLPRSSNFHLIIPLPSSPSPVTFLTFGLPDSSQRTMVQNAQSSYPD